MIRIILILVGIGTSTLLVAQPLDCVAYHSCLGNICGWICTYQNVVVTDYASTDLTFIDSQGYANIFQFVNCTLFEVPKKIFEAFTGVIVLDVSNSGIEAIRGETFRQAFLLSELNVSSNNLVELENYAFNGATHLEVLDLSNNNISEIEEKAFDDLKYLKTVILSGNNLKNLPDNVFNPLGKLNRLSLAGNNFELLQKDLFSKNLLLKHLFLDNNQFTTIDESLFDGLGEMETLSLEINNLTSFDLSKLNVKRLNVIKNKLENIRLSSSTQFLYAANNCITEITADNFETLTLQTLTLAWNNLTSIDGIDQISSLKVLDVSHNKIGALKLTGFSKLTKLFDLSLQNTKIPSLQHGMFSGLFLLKRLDISYNKLDQIDLDIFAWSHHLDEFYIDGNRLKEINYEAIPKSFPRLKKVSIADNSWNCSYLTRMIRSLNSHSVEVGGFKTENLVADKTNVKGIYCSDTMNPLAGWNGTAKHLDKYLNDSIPIVDSSEIKQIMQNAIEHIRNFNEQKQLIVNKTDQLEEEIYDLTKKLISQENEIFKVKKTILDINLTQLANATNTTFVSTELKKTMYDFNDFILNRINLTAESLSIKIHHQNFKIDKFIVKINENADKLLLLAKQVKLGLLSTKHITIQQESLKATAFTSVRGSSHVITTLIVVVLAALLLIALVVIFRNKITAQHLVAEDVNNEL